MSEEQKTLRYKFGIMVLDMLIENVSFRFITEKQKLILFLEKIVLNRTRWPTSIALFNAL
jgi:hypothetical protein